MDGFETDDPAKCVRVYSTEAAAFDVNPGEVSVAKRVRVNFVEIAVGEVDLDSGITFGGTVSDWFFVIVAIVVASGKRKKNDATQRVRCKNRDLNAFESDTPNVFEALKNETIECFDTSVEYLNRTDVFCVREDPRA